MTWHRGMKLISVLADLGSWCESMVVRNQRKTSRFSCENCGGISSMIIVIVKLSASWSDFVISSCPTTYLLCQLSFRHDFLPEDSVPADTIRQQLFVACRSPSVRIKVVSDLVWVVLSTQTHLW